MAILIIKNKPYKNENAPECLINYIYNPNKMPHMVYGGQGLSLFSPVNSIYITKNIFCHNSGKQMEHFIISFSETEAGSINIPKFRQFAYDVCEFFPHRQIMFAFHENNDEYEYDDDTSNLHIHFVLNTTNMKTGYKERINFNNIALLKKHIYTLLWHYNISTELITCFK